MPEEFPDSIDTDEQADDDTQPDTPARPRNDGINERKRKAWLKDPKNMTGDECRALRDHYKRNPFNMIRDGVFKIVNKDGELVRFIPNEEQAEVLAYVEAEYRAKRPVRVIVLKGRQIGMSTLAMAINLCLTITSSNKASHLVTHRKVTAKNLMRMYWTYYRNMPEFLRPKVDSKNKDGMQFEDPEFGCENCLIQVSSAEARDKLAIGWTYQFNTYSEKSEWPDQFGIIGALNPTVPKGWPSVIITESTGKQIGDIFYKDYFSSKLGKKPGWKAFFFAWYQQTDYRIPLSLNGVTEQEFIDTLCEDDQRMMEQFSLDAEQMNWYVTTREEWCLGEGETADVFRQKYPTTEEEAFFGTGQSCFDGARNKRDLERCARSERVPLDQLPTSASRDPQGVVLYARADLHTDAMNSYRNPEFRNNPLGDWYIYELPREGHKYVSSADVAEGKLAIKNVRNSGDYSAGGFWRYSYEDGEVPAIVQCAQLRKQNIDPREFARQINAGSIIYGDRTTKSKVRVIVERNGPGIAFIEQGKDDRMNFYNKQKLGSMYEVIAQEIGFQSTGGQCVGSRINVITQARECWARAHVLVNSLTTAKEMSTFARDERGKYCAISPHHDDTVTELYLMVECVRDLEGTIAPVPVKPNQTTRVEQRRYEPPPKVTLPKSIREKLERVQGGIIGVSI